MSSTKRITLGVSAAALALGAGFGIAGMASAATTPAPAPSTSATSDATPGTTDGPGKHGGHGRGGDRAGVQVSGLAAKLGVDEAKLTEALKAFRDANKPTPPAEGTKPDHAAREAALAKSLASSLGIEESKVTAALEELRTAAQADHASALKARLDKAVTDGTLNQAEADAVAKAVEKGVIGGGRH
jgi:hypothetical protein